MRIALRLIRQLAAQGVGLVLISHYLSEIFEVCDDLTVMRDGEVVADGPVHATTLPKVVAAMVGRDVETSRRAAQPGRVGAFPLMAVERLTGARPVARHQLHAPRRRGARGHGARRFRPQRAFSRGVFGASGRQASGRVLIDGKPVPAGDPAASLEAGIARSLTSDRLREGILLDFTLVENICLPILSRFGRGGMLDFAAMERTAERNIERLRVHAPGPFALARQLSGGQSAEGAVRKMVGDAAEGFRDGRADNRRRRRRERGDSKDHRRDRSRRRRHSARYDGSSTSWRCCATACSSCFGAPSSASSRART